MQKKHRSERNEHKSEATRKKQKTAEAKRKTYKKIKIDDEIYYVGSHVIVALDKKMTSGRDSSVAKILQIYTQEGCADPIVKVQWYMWPQELGIEEDYIAQEELFESEFVEEIEAQALDSPCKVLSIADFEQNQGDENTSLFFSRAKWNNHVKALEPDPKTWPRLCKCKQPSNPDRKYVGCDKCEEWFHIECVGLSSKEADAVESWVCHRCAGEGSPREDRSENSSEELNQL